MRFAYDTSDDLLPLLSSPEDPRVARSDFGSYTAQKFSDDLLGFNEGRPLSPEQEVLVSQSYDAVRWLAGHGVTYEPIYARQSFEKDGRFIFWGGLTLAADNEGVGLFDMELAAFERLGGRIRYDAGVTDLITDEEQVTGVMVGDEALAADAVILACWRVRSIRRLRSATLVRMGRWPKYAHTAQHGRRVADGGPPWVRWNMASLTAVTLRRWTCT